MQSSPVGVRVEGREGQVREGEVGSGSRWRQGGLESRLEWEWTGVVLCCVWIVVVASVKVGGCYDRGWGRGQGRGQKVGVGG